MTSYSTLFAVHAGLCMLTSGSRRQAFIFEADMTREQETWSDGDDEHDGGSCFVFGFTSCWLGSTGVLVVDCQAIGMNAARYLGAAGCNEEAAVVGGCIEYRPMCVCSYVG